MIRMFPKQYLRYIQTIEQQDDYLYNRIGPVRDARSLDSPMLDLLNVKYVITEDEIPNTKFTLVYNDEVRVYRNEAVAPRAFTLPQTCTVYADDELAAMGKYDPRQYVIVAGGKMQDAGKRDAILPLASCILRSVTVYKSNEVWIDVQADAPSWLVLGDSYFPGWVAYARPLGAGEEQEKELTITRVDGNFRAVQLAPGAVDGALPLQPALVQARRVHHVHRGDGAWSSSWACMPGAMPTTKARRIRPRGEWPRTALRPSSST